MRPCPQRRSERNPIYRKRSLFCWSLHCKTKWLKLLPQNLPWPTLSLIWRSCHFRREEGKSHLRLRMGKRKPGNHSLRFSLLSLREYCWAPGRPTVWKTITVQLWGFCFAEFSGAHSGSSTVLSALQNPQAFNPHVEVDSLSIITFHLGKQAQRG